MILPVYYWLVPLTSALAVIFLLFLPTKGKQQFEISYSVAVITSINIWLFTGILFKESIVIQKSSDSDWEYSENQDIVKDTSIMKVHILSSGDTVFPVTHYKVIKWN